MAFGDNKRTQAIQKSRQNLTLDEVVTPSKSSEPTIKRTIISHASAGSRTRILKESQRKKRYNFSMLEKDRDALSELTDLLDMNSDSATLTMLINRAIKVVSNPEYNRRQTDIFEFM